MRSMSWIWILVLLVLITPLTADCTDSQRIKHFTGIENAKAIPNVTPVKNIIIMIGDGMGHSQVTAARMAAHGTGIGLAMDIMPVLGNCLTFSLSDALITDSAAGATALATGVKTMNGMVSVDKDEKPLKTILEIAREMGKSTGIISTSEVTHATPACFLSHVKSRGENYEIARQMSENPPDVLLGGGFGFFLPSNVKDSYRKDNLDLLKVMRDKGLTVITDPVGFKSMDFQQRNSLIGLFAKKAMKKAGKRIPTLPDMVRAAVAMLSKNTNGFFLMVEGSQIDWEGHGNDLKGIVKETLDFDRAVGVVRDFAEEDRKTLVIVTADHETGGLSIIKADGPKETFAIGWTTGGHTASTVPVYAYGPNAEAFGGTLHNHHIPQLAIQAWGVKDFTSFAYNKTVNPAR